MSLEGEGEPLKPDQSLSDWLGKNPVTGTTLTEDKEPGVQRVMQVKPPAPQSPAYRDGEGLESWLGRTTPPPDNGLRQAWNQGAPQNPERAARILKAQLQTGYAPDFIDRNLDGIEADGKKYGADLHKLLAFTPLTAKYLSENPDRVALFLKDLPHIQDIETRFKGKDHPVLARRPDEELLKEAEATGAQLAPQLFPIQQSSQRAIELGTMEGPDVPVFPIYKTQEEMEKSIVESEFKRLQGIEEFVSSKEPLNYKDVLKRQLKENPLKPVPFSGSLMELGQNVELYSLAKKYEAGEATPDEIKHLKAEARMRLAIERRGMNWSGSAASSALGITAFAGETAMTVGLGGPTKKLILGTAEEASAALVRRVLARVIGTAVTTIPAGITAIPAQAVERMTPKSNLELDEKGNFKLTQTPGESPAKAIFAATLSRYADQLAAELVGMKFAKGGASADSLPLVKQSIAKEGLKEVGKFLGMGELSSAIKSVPFGSARIQDWQVPMVIRALSGDSRAQSELLGQSVVGFGMGASGAVLNNLQITRAQAQSDHDNIIHYRDLMTKTAEDVKGMEADKKAPEVVQEALTRVIPEDKAFTWIKADEFQKYYEQKGINPKEFATELTGKSDALDDVKPGALLKIPTAVYLSKIGKTPDGAFFQDHIADDPMRRSVNDSQAHLEELDKKMDAEKAKMKQEAEQKKAAKAPTSDDVIAQAKAEMDQIDEKLRFAKLQPGTDPEYIKALEAKRSSLESQITQAAPQDDLQGIGDKIAASAEAAGRPKPEAGAIGKIVESVYRMFGMRGKTAPKELMEKYGPEIQKGQPTEGPSLEQGTGSPKLSALHNLSAENLGFAHEMGGLAVPSIGVVPEGKSITGYGEITLIGRQQHGDPSQVPVHDADAYSPRFPDAEYKKAKTKDTQKLVDELKPFAKATDDRTAVDTLWDNAVNRPDPEKTVNELLRSRAAAMWFLSSKGEKVEPKTLVIEAKDTRAPFVGSHIFQEFVKSGEYAKVDHNDPASWEKYSNVVRRSIEDFFSEKVGMSDEEKEDNKYLRDTYLSNFIDNLGDAHIGDEHRIKEAIRRIRSTEVDLDATQKALGKALKGREGEFKNWLEKKILGLHPEPMLTVGGKKVPYTLDNIVEAMSGRVRGQEKTMTFGEGAARAAASKKFSNLEQMRRAAKSIAGENEVNVSRENAQYLMEQYRDLVTPFTTYMSPIRAGSIDTWEALDASMRAMAKWAKTGAKDEASMRRALSSEGFKDVSQEAIDKAMEAGKAWLKAPVPYFEAKPQRAVGLDEFAGAVIPEDASAETKAILAENKIPFKTYEKGNDVSRTRTVDQFRNVLAGQGQNVLFQGGKSVPPFFSRLQQTLEAKMPGSARVDQVRGIVKEVKPEELKWSGLEDFLKGKEKVSKKELMDFLRANQLDVKDVMKGDNRESPIVTKARETLDKVERDRDEALETLRKKMVDNGIIEDWVPLDRNVSKLWDPEIEEKLKQANLEGHLEAFKVLHQTSTKALDHLHDMLGTVPPSSPTKYESYTLPGGENYRELLLTMPQKAKALPEGYSVVEDPAAVGAKWSVKGPPDKSGADVRYGFGNTKEEAIAAAFGNRDTFKSSHFVEQNVLAHVRFDDRTDADGKKMLFLEEIQSDWHQKGRAKGYVNEIDKAAQDRLDAALDEHARLRSERAALQTAQADERYNSPSFKAFDEKIRAARQRLDELQDRIDELRSEAPENKVPDAPFKKTWHEFAMKRMIRYAAENGYDRIGWTTGEQQAERYDLSKQVEGIRAEKLAPGEGTDYWSIQYRRSATGDWQDMVEDGVPSEKIEDYVGKDLAKKIIEGQGKRHVMKVAESGVENYPWNVVDQDGDVVHSFEKKEQAEALAKRQNDAEGDAQHFHGLDLKVGGEGMKGFYDQMLPAFADKFGKKYGAQVEDSEIVSSSVPPGNRAPRESRETVHSLPITPELRKAALEQGFSLFQPGQGGEEGPLGSYIPNSVTGDKAVINAFENGNPTTIPHELGHHFLEVMADLATKPQPTLSLEAGHNFTIREDFQKFLEWRGIKDVDAWNNMTLDEKRPHHEAWADAYWKWLYEGKAPSAALRSIFFRFRQWIGAVYEKMKGKGIEIPDEIRGVFERLHATDQEIQAAKERLGRLEPFLEDLPGLSFSPAEREQIASLRAQADQAATERLDKEALADINEQRTKEYQENRVRVKGEVTKEFNETKEAKALAYFTDWKKPDGLALDEGMPLFKLSAESVKEEYPGLDLKSIPKGMLDQDFKEDNGIDAQSAADMFKFNSGKELIDALINTDRETSINRETDARVTPPAPYETLPEEARKAIHNDAEQKLNIYSMLWLAKNELPDQQSLIRRFTDPVKYLKEARDYAEEKVGKESYSSLDPREYERRERDSRKAARDAALQKNYREAVTQKDRETLSAALYSAAIDAKEQAEKNATFMRKFEDRSVQAELGKAGKDYQDVIADLNDSYGFTNESASKKESRVILAKFVAEQQANSKDGGQPLIVPDWMQKEANRKNWKELPLSQLQEIRDLAEQILAMARYDNKANWLKKAMDFDVVRKELTDQLKGTRESLPIDPSRNAANLKDRLSKVLRSTDATMVKMEQLIRELDGADINGPFHRYMMFGASDAQAAELDMSKELKDDLREAFQSLPKELRKRQSEKINLPGRRRITRFDTLGFGLQAGNSGNWEKFNAGEAERKGGFTPQEISGFLDDLEKPEKDLIQRLGDIMEKHWPEIAALYKKLTGLEPEKVEVGPQHPAFDGYRGWYAPIIYDARDSKAGEAQQYAMIGETTTRGYISSTTASGHTKKRTGFTAPMDTDLQNIPMHLDSVVHDLTHREWILGMNKLLNDPEFSSVFKDRVGKEYLDQMKGWVKEIANDRNNPSLPNMWTWKSFFNSTRLNMGMALTGYKAATLLHHGTSIEAAIGDVGFGYMARGYLKFRAPFDAYKEMVQESGEMRHFWETGDRDLQDVYRMTQGKSDPISLSQRGAANAVGFMNILRAIPTYFAGKAKAMDTLPEEIVGPEREQLAIRAGEELVRLRVGAGAAKDRAAIMSKSSEFMKVFTTFFTPGSVEYNAFHDAKADIGRSGMGDIPRLVTRIFWTWIAVSMTQKAITGHTPNEDKGETWWGWAGKNVALYPFESVPMLRDLAEYVTSGREPSSGNPVSREFSQAAHLVGALTKGAQGKTSAAHAAEEVARTTSMMLGIPAEQGFIWGDYMHDLSTGETSPNNFWELWHNILRYHRKR